MAPLSSLWLLRLLQTQPGTAAFPGHPLPEPLDLILWPLCPGAVRDLGSQVTAGAGTAGVGFAVDICPRTPSHREGRPRADAVA